MSSKETIQSAISNFDSNQFRASNLALLNALGYSSDRTLIIPDSDPEAFREIAESYTGRRLNVEKSKFSDWEKVDILFQFTGEELSSQMGLFQNGDLQPDLDTSYLFFAIALRGSQYSRTALADITRQINQLFPIPVLVVFSYNNALSIAVISRRQNKRDENRQVLESVSLIRDIRITHPHRAHIDILQGLSLEKLSQWIDDNGKRKNFDGLQSALLYVLDTEELNNRFYRDLFRWFTRATEEATFPKNQVRTLSSEEHIIRLITRLLFVWFIKEKGLIADALFNETQIRRLLTNYTPDTGDSYYRAILQNLFFATLNTEIDKREFSKKGNATHRNFSRYRYASEISDLDALLALFAKTPFINGGLFDCLDSEKSTKHGGWRLDCFTDISKHRSQYSIPNRLFFDNDGLLTLFNRYKFTVEENTPTEQDVALDPELLGKVFEQLLAAYNPETRDTVRRQTGSYYTPRPVVDYMVDEAILLSLTKTTNPEDGDDKFWNERLCYLLDYADAFDDAEDLFTEVERKSIIRAIAEIKALDPAVGSGAFPMGILHKLTLVLRRLDPDNKHWKALQKELAGTRAEAAFDTENKEERDAELEEISRIFEHYRDSDFGRKLYLIQNSIFGMDIQPIACQIAKLRFFISLAIEQHPTSDAANNYGIRPLPNLETRFVAADSLIGLKEHERQLLIEDDTFQQKRKEIEAIRERYFIAGTRKQKLQCIDEEKACRESLEQMLEDEKESRLADNRRAIDQKAAQLPNKKDRKKFLEEELKKHEAYKKRMEDHFQDALKVAQWDPYNQNSKADWFDPGYMFGITDGVDVVIGNPPYIQLQKNGGELGRRYSGAAFETFTRAGDIYQLFYERGCQLLTPQRGLLSYITSNSWLKAEYGKKTRRYLATQHTPLRLVEMGKDVFENAIVDTSILMLRHGPGDKVGKAVDMNKLRDKAFPPEESRWVPFQPQGEQPWSVLPTIEQAIMDKMQGTGTPLKDWDVDINRGIVTGYNEAFIIDEMTRQALVAEDPKSSEIIKPVLRGRDIQRYQAQWASQFIITTFPSMKIDIDDYPAVRNHLLSFGKSRLMQNGKQLADGSTSRKKTQNLWFEVQDSIAYHEEFAKEKLFWMDMTDRGRFAYSRTEIYCNNKGFVLSGNSLKYLCALLNSALITWQLRNIARTTGMGLTQWEKFSVERLSIPQISPAKQQTFIRLVNKILKIKQADPQADISVQEAEIDRLVYQLYDLTAEEIALIESMNNY